MPDVDARLIVIGVIIGIVLLYNAVEIIEARREEKERNKSHHEEEEQ